MINGANDLMALLRLVSKSMVTGAITRNAIHSLIDATITLYSFRKVESMPNSDYLKKFNGLVKVFEHFGGEPGTIGGELIEPFKNPKISKFSNPFKFLDLRSSNSYLNGTLSGFLIFFQFNPIFALKVDFLIIISLLVIFTSKNQMFAPKR